MNTTRDEYAPAATWKTAVDFIFKPYFNRVKLGEGGLVVFNLFHSVYAHHHFSTIIVEVVLSFFVMCALYGFNDFNDRHKDGQNDKKDKSFVTSILQHEKLFIILNLVLTLVTIVFAFFLRGTFKAEIVLLVYMVNILYSKKFKSFPVIDIITVMVWGGLYSMIAGEFQWMLALTVGVMTGVAHLFQIMTDKISDSHSGIKTTLVAMPETELLFLSGLCLILGVLLFMSAGIWWALSALLPVLIYTISRRVTLSWHISRAYFFICWVGLLTLLYGTP